MGSFRIILHSGQQEESPLMTAMDGQALQSWTGDGGLRSCAETNYYIGDNGGERIGGIGGT